MLAKVHKSSSCSETLFRIPYILSSPLHGLQSSGLEIKCIFHPCNRCYKMRIFYFPLSQFYPNIQWTVGNTLALTLQLYGKYKSFTAPVFKLSPCCCNDRLSSRYFPGVWVLKADVSKHCVGSIFNRGWSVNRQCEWESESFTALLIICNLKS
jgi:hypothetical protein